MSAYKNRVSRTTEQKVLERDTLYDINDNPVAKAEPEISDVQESSSFFGSNRFGGGQGGNQDEQIQLLRQQAEAGDPNAQFQLAQYLYFGNDELGIEAQPLEADRLFQQAAQNNHVGASVNFAIMLINSSLN